MSATPTSILAAVSAKPPVADHRLDRLGAAGSLICAAHCALWPLALALVPALGLSVLASPLFERSFVVFAGTLATVSLIPGYRRHRSPRALLLLLPGLLGIGLGAFGSAEHTTWTHALLMTTGGVLVAASHLFNLSLIRRMARGKANAAC